jgi:hypothetical protein
MYDGKITIGTELDTKSVDAQINKLQYDLKHMINDLETDKIAPVSLKMSEGDRIKLENDIEKVNNKIISLRESMNDTSNESDRLGKNISKNMKNSVSKLKKFGLALFSIRSIYSLVSKASSQYLSQDTELAEKLQSVWVGLGSFLAPAIERVSNLLLKGLGYLNEFIKALTGIDYIARANAKALEKQAKAQKKLNNQTYDFDEIRKQQEMTSESASSSSGMIDIPELDSKIVKKLQDLAFWLKENQDLVKAVGITLLTVFGAYKIAKLVSNIGSLIGTAGTGLTGLLSVLKVLGTIGVIAISVSLLYTALTGRDLLDDINKIKEGLKDLDEISKERADKSNELTEKYKKNLETLGESIEKLSNEDIQAFINQTNIATESTNEVSESLFEKNKNLASTTEEYKANTTVMENNLETLGIFKTELEAIKDKLQKENEELDKNSEKYKENDDLINQINNSLKNIDGYTATATANLTIQDNADDWATNLSKRLSNFFGGVSQTITGWFNPSKKTKAYALGGIVTQPTRALIGEAGYPEAVVPMTADYLSTLASAIAQYGGGGSSQPINIYLNGRLIQREINNQTQKNNFVTNK